MDLTPIADNCHPAALDEDIETRKREARAKLEKRALFRLEYDTIGSSWMSAVVEPELTKPYFRRLKEFLLAEQQQQQHKIFPPAPLIYSWTRYSDFSATRVVIIGQDPYHNDGQATGLAFSVPVGYRPLPPSLLNIYKELASDIPNFTPPSHGDLGGWARQGVLLLNACLTVRAHSPNSHAGRGWELFTDAVIRCLSIRSKCPLVFMLWGSHAQKKGLGAIGRSKFHLVLRAAHPSPLSASRGFLGCHHFSQCNAFLVKNGLDPIDWAALN